MLQLSYALEAKVPFPPRVMVVYSGITGLGVAFSPFPTDAVSLQEQPVMEGAPNQPLPPKLNFYTSIGGL